MCDTGEPVYLSLHDWGGWQSSVSACVREINLWTGHGHPLRFSGPCRSQVTAVPTSASQMGRSSQPHFRAGPSCLPSLWDPVWCFLLKLPRASYAQSKGQQRAVQLPPAGPLQRANSAPRGP